MTEVRDRNSLFAWLREAALIVAVVGAAWTIGGAVARVEAKVDHNADLIERNAAAIERNAQALERTVQAIAELQASMAALNGRYEEHTRAHEQLASR